MCNIDDCKARRTAPTAHLCRWVCICGNLIKEEPQLASLRPATHTAVGTCCSHSLPAHMKSMAMPIENVEETPEHGAHDSRELYREDPPGARYEWDDVNNTIKEKDLTIS